MQQLRSFISVNQSIFPAQMRTFQFDTLSLTLNG
jgi:hypothetical protein